MSKGKRNALVEKITNIVIEKPWVCVSLMMLLFFAFAPGLTMFQEKYDVRIWFRESDPNIKILNHFERHFGNDERILVVMHSPSGIFDKESATTLREITDKMWKVPEVMRVESLANHNFTTSEDDELIIEPFFIEEGEFSQDYLDKKKSQAMKDRVMPDYLVTKDGKTAMIFGHLVPTLDSSPNYENITKSTQKLLDAYRGKSDHKFYVTGEAPVNEAFREVSTSDGQRLLPLLFLCVVIYLLFIFRSISATILPFLVTTGTTVVTMGYCFYIGYKFDSILSILPAIIIAVAIADSVHLIVSFLQYRANGYDRKEGTIKALRKNIVPTFLTSISTMIGFLSLTFTEIVPIRQLGHLAGVSCIMAWLFTVFFVGPLLYKIPFKIPKHFTLENGGKNTSGIPYKLTVFIKKFRWPIILVFTAISITGIYVGSKNRVNSNPYKYFSHETPLRIANDFVRSSFGGDSGPELVINAGKEDGIKDPAFLKKVESFKAWLDSQDYIIKTVDIIDIIKEMNQQLDNGKEESYKLPDTQSAVAEELFLYTMGLPQGMDLNDRMTLKYDSMRMSIIWNLFDTRGWLAHVDIIEKKAKEFGLDLHPTGKFLLFQRMMDYVVLTLVKSVTMAMILVGILMMILFRSVKLGLISMIPNILPLFFGAAFMYVTGIDLNLGSSLVASVCLGIAVDDTIHFLSNYYRLRKDEGLSVEETIQNIYTFTGAALVITTMILVTGFGVYIFGDFVPNVHFGTLTAVVLFMALVVDMFFLPALLMVLEGRKGKS